MAYNIYICGKANMRAKLSWADAVVLVVWALPLIFLLHQYPLLPPRVALHFNLQGEVDRYGAKQELLTTILVLCGIPLGVSLLVRFLPSIDPKKKVQYSQSVLIKISYAVVFLFTVLNFLIIYSTEAGHFIMNTRLILSLIALFFAYMGSSFDNLKPNYFVGIRTPWTLENETVWKKTHQLGRRLWLPGGLLLAVLCWVLPGMAALIVFFIGIAVMVLIPVVYSYFCYRQLPK